MTRVRITHRDTRYGHICHICAGPKTEQAKTCHGCYVDSLRDAGYWKRRTCMCGGPKKKDSLRCHRCWALSMVGNQLAAGRCQPAGHPWRAKRFDRQAA